MLTEIQQDISEHELPWLMLSHNSFFDLSTNEIHQLNLAPYSSHRTLVCGSSHGWLVIVNEISEIRLLNPITLATIPLPKLPVTIRVDFNDKERPPMCLIKVVLSSSPSLTDEFTAFAMLHFKKFAFFKKGSDSWVVVDWDITRNWVDVIYRNSYFFLVDVNGMIAGFDVGLRQISHLEMTRIPFANDRRYLVAFKDDMLLVIQSGLLEPRGCRGFQTVGFRIYKMNWSMPKWEQIHSLGEHSLFVGAKSSLCCCAADFVGCRPNCIYFTADYLDRKEAYYLYKKEVGIYSLSDESIEPLPGNPQSSFGHSVWVEPIP